MNGRIRRGKGATGQSCQATSCQATLIIFGKLLCWWLWGDGKQRDGAVNHPHPPLQCCVCFISGPASSVPVHNTASSFAIWLEGMQKAFHPADFLVKLSKLTQAQLSNEKEAAKANSKCTVPHCCRKGAKREKKTHLPDLHAKRGENQILYRRTYNQQMAPCLDFSCSFQSLTTFPSCSHFEILSAALNLMDGPQPRADLSCVFWGSQQALWPWISIKRLSALNQPSSISWIASGSQAQMAALQNSKAMLYPVKFFTTKSLGRCQPCWLANSCCQWAVSLMEWPVHKCNFTQLLLICTFTIFYMFKCVLPLASRSSIYSCHRASLIEGVQGF